MPHLVRVSRGNVEQAFRQFSKAINSDPLARRMRTRTFNEKPTQRRRRERSENARRKENMALFANLRVIYTRRARGF